MQHCLLVSVHVGSTALSGMAGYLWLTPRGVDSPWPVAISDSVDACLETVLGDYPVLPGEDGNPGWDPDDIADMAEDVPGQPNILTDGSRGKESQALVGISGAGAFVQTAPKVFDGRAWEHAKDLDLADDSCRCFCICTWLAAEFAAR